MSCVTFRFRRSRADDQPWCLELAHRGRFREQNIGVGIVYETDFELSHPLQVGHALTLATALVHDKKAEAFVSGQSLHLPMVREVLRCYQQSLHVKDAHSYCWFATKYTYDLTVTTYTIDLDAAKTLLFPCRCAANHAYGIHPEQPGTIDEQVDAALVRAGTRWCPRLANLTAWREAQAAMRTV